jgi:hypothetical protein
VPEASFTAFDRNCVWGGGRTNRTYGLPCGPSRLNPDGTSCAEKLKVPRTSEYTFGAEREIVLAVGLGGDVVYRPFDNLYVARETNRIWTSGGMAEDLNGAYLTGRREEVMDLATPDEARRRYLVLTAGIHKREGNLKFSTTYTWTRLQGNVDNAITGDWGKNPVKDAYYLYSSLPDHELVIDRAHPPIRLGDAVQPNFSQRRVR